MLYSMSVSALESNVIIVISKSLSAKLLKKKTFLIVCDSDTGGIAVLMNNTFFFILSDPNIKKSRQRPIPI